MKTLVIFLILVIACVPISYAAVIDIPGISSGEMGGYVPLREDMGVKKFIYVGSSVVASVRGPEVEYYHQGRMSNRITTDSSGNLDKEFKSLPFGQKVVNSGVDYPFTGKEEDESSLYYFGARYYDDNLGRFSGVDPVEGNQPYSYVESNPMNYVDPTGMESWTLNQQNIFQDPPGWVNEKFGESMYNSLWGDVRDTNSEINFYNLPFEAYGFSNSKTGEAWADYGNGKLTEYNMGGQALSDMDLRRMSGDVGYFEELVHQAPAIVLSLFAAHLIRGAPVELQGGIRPVYRMPNGAVRKHIIHRGVFNNEVALQAEMEARGIPTARILRTRILKDEFGMNGFRGYIDRQFIPGREFGEVLASGEATPGMIRQFNNIYGRHPYRDPGFVPFTYDETVSRFSGVHTNIMVTPEGNLVQYDPF